MTRPFLMMFVAIASLFFVSPPCVFLPRCRLLHQFISFCICYTQPYDSSFPSALALYIFFLFLLHSAYILASLVSTPFSLSLSFNLFSFLPLLPTGLFLWLFNDVVVVMMMMVMGGVGAVVVAVVALSYCSLAHWWRAPFRLSHSSRASSFRINAGTVTLLPSNEDSSVPACVCVRARGADATSTWTWAVATQAWLLYIRIYTQHIRAALSAHVVVANEAFQCWKKNNAPPKLLLRIRFVVFINAIIDKSDEARTLLKIHMINQIVRKIFFTTLLLRYGRITSKSL